MAWVPACHLNKGFLFRICPRRKATQLTIFVVGCLILGGGYWVLLGNWVYGDASWILSGIFSVPRKRSFFHELESLDSVTKRKSVFNEFLSGVPISGRGARDKDVLDFLMSEERLSRICIRKMGRLGNRIFQVAGLLGIAEDKGMSPFIESDNELVGLFQLPDVEIVSPGHCRLYPEHHDLRTRAIDLETYNFSNKIDHQIVGYFQSWKYFRNITTFIRRQFELKATVKHSAGVRLMKTVLLQGFSLDALMHATLIAVHIRRGDTVGSEASTVPSSYLQHATDYVRSRFKNILFIVGSDDIRWARLAMDYRDTVFLNGNTAELDFAILSMCDHTVMTIGTFGWWIAWLVNGTTIYYKYPHVKNSNLDSYTVMDDYIPKHWIPME